MNYIYMPSIETLRHVCTSVAKACEYRQIDRPTVKFRGTLKLHGTNGSVRVHNDKVVATTRSSILTIQNDNYGFAHFVAGCEGLFFALASEIAGSDELIFFGEWCGPGIQKKTAISQLPERVFVIFGAYNVVSEKWIDLHEHAPCTMLKVANEARVYFITQVPTYEITIDFNDPSVAAEKLHELTVEVEELCPFGKMMGVEGFGEGIVWESIDHDQRLTFKTKGEKHKKGGEREKVAVDPEKTANVNALVDLLLPEWRLEQGISHLQEKGIPVDEKSTGQYLKWILGDILKEEADRIAANPYSWRELSGTVTTRARDYLMTHLDREVGLTT